MFLIHFLLLLWLRMRIPSEELLVECIKSDTGVQVAFALLFLSSPVGAAAEVSGIPYSGQAYFVMLAALAIYIGSHRSLYRATPAAINLEQVLY